MPGLSSIRERSTVVARDTMLSMTLPVAASCDWRSSWRAARWLPRYWARVEAVADPSFCSRLTRSSRRERVWRWRPAARSLSSVYARSSLLVARTQRVCDASTSSVWVRSVSTLVRISAREVAVVRASSRSQSRRASAAREEVTIAPRMSAMWLLMAVMRALSVTRSTAWAPGEFCTPLALRAAGGGTPGS